MLLAAFNAIDQNALRSMHLESTKLFFFIQLHHFELNVYE